MTYRVAATMILFFVLGSARPAHADSATAEALFRAGKALAAEKNWTEACPKFGASYKLDKQLGTLLNWADCLENGGMLASSWARWNEALEWARRAADDRLKYIDDRQHAIAPRLPQLSIIIENPVESLSVRRGDTLVPPASYGLPIPVDPGERIISVWRKDAKLHEQTITTVEGETAEIKLDLAEIDSAHPVAPPPPLPPDPKPVTTPPPPPPPPPTPPYDPTHRNVGIAMSIAGLAATLAAGGLEIAALVKKGQADEPDMCVGIYCSPRGFEAAEDAQTFAEAGQWVGIGGLAVLAVGATIWLTAPPAPSDDSARLWLKPRMSLSHHSLTLGGHF